MEVDGAYRPSWRSARGWWPDDADYGWYGGVNSTNSSGFRFAGRRPFPMETLKALVTTVHGGVPRPMAPMHGTET